MDVRTIKENNARLLTLMSAYLNCFADAIDGTDVQEIARSCSVSPRYAYAQLLAASCGLDTLGADAQFFREWMLPMLSTPDPTEFERDAYLRTVRFPEAASGDWTFTYGRYAPYEAFVCGDLRTFPNGKVLPTVGFFEREYVFPSVQEHGREWMCVVPNEIVTMAAPLGRASGNVLTYGLGLGYFAFHASDKDTVTRVDVVERDEKVIELFEKYLLPQFPQSGKIRVICADALDFARERAAGYDYIFADIWHDPSDGVPLYRRLKEYESCAPGARFDYWCEDTIIHYL